MATHLRDETPIETAADICDALVSGLDQHAKTKTLAPTWVALRDEGDDLKAKKEKNARRLRRSSLGVGLRDADWDPEVAGFGRRTVDDSNGKRDQSPYIRFFSPGSAPSDVQRLAPEDEVDFGKKCLTELARNPTEPLAVDWSPRLTAVNGPLEAALIERDAAKAEGDSLKTSQLLFLKKVNLALDDLEGDLTKLFPGEPKRVSAFLAVTR